MKERCQAQPTHWVHQVRGEKEPTSQHLFSWEDNCDRRYVNFDTLEGNGTKEMSYAYDNAVNRYSHEDKRKIQKHNRRYQGSGGYGRDVRDNDKRQRRDYHR